MIRMTHDTIPAALLTAARPALGRLTTSGEEGSAVTRRATPRRERTSIHRSLLGRVTPRHAALATTGHPLTLEASRPNRAPLLGERCLIPVYPVTVVTRFPTVTQFTQSPSGDWSPGVI